MTIPYPRISPIAFHVGPLAVRWYGIMYLLGYMVGTSVAKIRSRRGLWTLTPADIDTLVGYLLVGMFIGARLVYVTVYDWPAYRAHPLDIFAVWHGGLSFHGAALGMTIACALFARRKRMPFLMVADGLAVCAPPGLFFGRIGNFINGELYGRAASVPWAMVFPADPQRVPRHPSQLYEAACEGILLGLVLWALQAVLARRARAGRDFHDGYLSAAFLIGYGLIRFLVEYTRQPDAQLGFVLGPFSMGQLLSSLMIVAGLALAFAARARHARPLGPADASAVTP
jgi:phosphatidylglycerol---prolipoprotein diacylglyceryl transferase